MPATDQPDTESSLHHKGRPRGMLLTAPEKVNVLPLSDSGMTMEQLRGNYEAILRTRVISYPIPFTIIREIGWGRQGTVVLVRRRGARGCQTEHALKIFDPALYRSTAEYWTDMGRIASQVSQLHRLQSLHLVPTHCYEETYGIGYIQMEAIDGLDLRRLMTRESLETAQRKLAPADGERFTRTIFRIEGDRLCLQPGITVHILRGILRGLEQVHVLNFLHGDIKPANIMINRLGNVMLVDFGRAVMVGERLTFLLGSPMYMAPETHLREPGRPQSDCYSLGLVALEMLRGEKLTATEEVSEDELLRIKLDLPQRLPDLLPRHVRENKALMFILQKLLEPDPARRYAGAREAEGGPQGLRIISKQLVRADLDSEYERDLADYLATLVDPETQRVNGPSPSEAQRGSALYRPPAAANDRPTPPPSAASTTVCMT